MSMFVGSEFYRHSMPIAIGEIMNNVLYGEVDRSPFFELEFMPRANLDYIFPPNLLSMEMMGIADAGKTELLNHVVRLLRESGVSCRVFREFQLSVEDIKIYQTAMSATEGLKRPEDYLFKDKLIQVLESMKLLATGRYIDELVNESSAIGKNGTPTVYILERGPNDHIALVNWLMSYAKYVSINLDKELNMEEITDELLFALCQTKYFHSVVHLYVNKLDTLLNRRKKAGNTRRGVMGNDYDQSIVNDGYKRWLTYFYPILQCGLLNIDGELALERNVEVFKNYVLRHFNMM